MDTVLSPRERMVITLRYNGGATLNMSDARKFNSQNYLMETTIVPKYNYKWVTSGFASYSGENGASGVCTD